MALGQKKVFIEALILSVFVFSAGITLGFFIESYRGDKLNSIYTQSEIDFLDVRLQTQLTEVISPECDLLIEENIKFGDRIYEEAQQLSRYEGAQRLSEGLITQHKKYDLLRVQFWLNSLRIKDKCNATYDILLYLYEYEEPTLDTKAKQNVYSKVLQEVKEEMGGGVLLIPMAGDLDIQSINFIRNAYDITQLPTILINEEIKITDLPTKEEILEILNGN